MSSGRLEACQPDLVGPDTSQLTQATYYPWNGVFIPSKSCWPWLVSCSCFQPKNLPPTTGQLGPDCSASPYTLSGPDGCPHPQAPATSPSYLPYSCHMTITCTVQILNEQRHHQQHSIPPLSWQCLAVGSELCHGALEPSGSPHTAQSQSSSAG